MKQILLIGLIGFLQLISTSSLGNQEISTELDTLRIPAEKDYDDTCETIFKGRVERAGKWRSCVIEKSVKLLANKLVTTHPLTLRKSNVTLDCNGSTIEGKYDTEISDYPEERYGLTIRSVVNQAPQTNILVKNCKFQNLSAGAIAVRTDLDDETSYRLIMEQRKTYEAIRARSPRNVVLQNISSYNSGRTAVYFYPGIVGAKLLDSTIVDSGISKVTGRANRNSPAVYIDAGAKGILIQGNTFKGNTREAVAIDSSGDNIIKNNKFSGHKKGGIFLYKNCQERVMPKPPKDKPDYEYHKWSKTRLDPSSRNLIAGNSFQNEVKGIWIASRQAADLGTWGCGDPSPYKNPVKGDLYIYLDYAKDNKIQNNTFTNVTTGIVVEDDRTSIEGNTFSGGTDAISVGTRYRAELLNKPVSGTIIKGNKFSALKGKAVLFPYPAVDTVSDVNAPKAEYKGFLKEKGKETSFWTPGVVTRQEALDHCKWKQGKFPKAGIRCTWGKETILNIAEPKL